MKKIIDPIDKALLESELTEDIFLRKTNKSENEIYIFTHDQAPNVFRETCRLRELSFRSAGGGTGEEIDMDEFDVCEHPYKQLIVWDPQAKEILGGYRYIVCGEMPRNEKGEVEMATTSLFHFSEEFKESYLPYIIELGRSFVQPAYQSSKINPKSIFALDNLWDGLGALIVEHPEIKYFFGKVTMYPSYNKHARDLILHFFTRFFNDPQNLVVPVEPMDSNKDAEHIHSIFENLDYTEAYKALSIEVRKLGENIPPLINAYMGLSSTMKTFGTVINHHFGEVEETGIMINVDEIYDQKITRHVSTYLEEMSEGFNSNIIHLQ